MRRRRFERGKARLGWLLLCALVGGASGGYFGFYLPYRSREREQQRRIETLQRVVGRLMSERRIADVVLVDHTLDPNTGDPVLTLRFVEYDRADEPLPARYFRVIGDEVHFDALVIRFKDEYVAAGDALRGHSIHLFRRVYGSRQAPDNAELVDDSALSRDGIPDVYRIDDAPNPYEVELWNNFWTYANDPEAAERLGVKVLMGQVVYTRLLADRTYRLSIEADGGMSIVPKSIPPVLAQPG